MMQRIEAVGASSGEIREAYDKISGLYRIIQDLLGKSLQRRGIRLLAPESGDQVLEIGFGTGWALMELSKIVEGEGRAVGVDFSGRMARIAEGKAKRREWLRPHIVLAEAKELPFRSGIFDCIFMAETFELLEAQEMEQVLQESNRVMGRGAKGVFISMSDKEMNVSQKLYRLLHRTFPQYFNCRPIPLEEILDTRFDIAEAEYFKAGGVFPMEAVLVTKG